MTFWLYDKKNEEPAIYGSLVAVQQNTTLHITDLYKHFSIPKNKDAINEANAKFKQAILKANDEKDKALVVDIEKAKKDFEIKVERAEKQKNSIKKLYNTSYEDERYEMHKLPIIRAAKEKK